MNTFNNLLLESSRNTLTAIAGEFRTDRNNEMITLEQLAYAAQYCGECYINRSTTLIDILKEGDICLVTVKDYSPSINDHITKGTVISIGKASLKVKLESTGDILTFTKQGVERGAKYSCHYIRVLKAPELFDVIVNERNEALRQIRARNEVIKSIRSRDHYVKRPGRGLTDEQLMQLDELLKSFDR